VVYFKFSNFIFFESLCLRAFVARDLSSYKESMMAAMIKRIFIGIGIFLSFFILLPVGSFFYLKTDHAQQLIQAKVSDKIPGEISWEKFRFSLLDGKFELKNVLIKGPSNDEIAGFDRFFIEMSWDTLLKKELTIAALIIEKPWTKLQTDPQGKINLIRAFSASTKEKKEPDQKTKKAKSLPINIVVQSFKLVQGFFSYEAPSEDLKAVLHKIDLNADVNLFKQSGNLFFQVGEGNIKSPKIQTKLDRFNLKATLKEGRIDPLVIQADTPFSKLIFSGNITDLSDKPVSDLVLDLDVFLPEVRKTFKMEQALTGKIRAHLAAKGTWNNGTDEKLTFLERMKDLKTTLSLKGEDLAFEDFRVDEVIADLEFTEGRLHMDRVKLDNKNSSLGIVGRARILEPKTMQLLKDPVFNVDVEGDILFLEDFTDKLKGKFSLAGHFEGSMRRPKGTLSLDGTDIDAGVQQFKEVRLQSLIDDKTIRIKALEILLAPGEVMEGTGWVSFDKHYHIDLKSKGIDLRHIDMISDNKVVEGKILFDLTGDGSFENPEVKGDITLNDLLVNKKNVDDLQMYLDLQDHLVRISGKQNFEFNGSFHIRKKDLFASLVFDETDLEPYFYLLDQKDLSGMLTGKIEARGNAEKIDQIQAVADFSKFNLFFMEKKLVGTRDFKAFFKDQELSIPSLNLILLDEGRLKIKGKGKIDGRLAFQAEGNIPMNSIALLVEDLSDITGDLLFSTNMEGTFSEPDIRADVELKKIGFTVPGLLQPLHDLNGQIRITPQAVTIDGIDGRMDTGRFDLSGKIDLVKFQPAGVLMKVNAHALPLQVPDTLNLLVNTDLKIQGTPEKSTIQGEVVVLEGDYYKDVKLDLLQVIEQKEREVSLPPSEITVPFLKNMGLDITVTHRNPFLVDNNLAELEVVPDLRISGNVNNPVITGQARIESGTVEFRKNTFVVKKGVIDFLNPYKTEPTVDITSEVNVREWTVYLEIKGPPDRLEFKLTSDPPEEDGDILSVLLFGKTTSELIDGEGGTSGSPEQMVVQMIASKFGEDIKKAAELDVFEVEFPEDEGEAHLDRVKVTIGKELSRRINLKYSVESKDGEMIQRAIAEYKVLENILVSGFQDTSGVFGGALHFRLEFR